jgi:hypothetical protein
MKTYYISFGQIHVHSVNGKTFDKDCICAIEAKDEEEAREKAFECFGNKWCFIYKEIPDMKWFPRGIINL